MSEIKDSKAEKLWDLRKRSADALERKNYSAAVQLSDEILTSNSPMHPEFVQMTLQTKGFALFYLKKYSETINLMTKALDFVDKYDEQFEFPQGNKLLALRYRGLAYQKMKRYNEAWCDFDEMVETDMRKFSGLLELAELFIESNRSSQAEKMLKLASERSAEWENSDYWKSEIRKVKEKIKD